MTFLMSIKPEYAELILSRKKTVEIRKKRIHAVAGDVVIIYATTPIKRIVGYFTIKCIDYGPVLQIWETYGNDSCLSLESYCMYVHDANMVCAICLGDATRTRAIDLDTIRNNYHIHIPQSYMCLDDVLAKEIKSILIASKQQS